MLTDIEIAQQAKMLPIKEIAAQIGIDEADIEPYGHYKAKLSESLYAKTACRPDGKLILVTAINPTPAGEGKTTVSVGLGQAMAKIGKKAVLAFSGPGIRHQGRCCRRRLFPGRPHGGHQPAFHRRHPRHDRCQ